MKKTLAVLLVVAALAVTVFASGKPSSFSGTLTLTFGHVRNPDGTLRSLKGLQLPFTAEPIEASKLDRRKREGHGPFVSSLGAPARLEIPASPADTLLALIARPPLSVTTVYNADAGSGYGVIDGSDPTSLDDMVLQGGANLPWQNLTFGVDVAVLHDFLVRWRCYRTYTEGLGHDVSAFSNEFADFGGILYANQIPGVGTYKITVTVAPAGAVAPVDAIFVAQQFRSTQPNGEGPFDTAMRNVYNPTAPPSIGSSDNVFWYDWDAMNGIYAEDEIDNFGEESFANMLHTLTVSGSQETLVPFTFQLLHGTYISGEVTDFWYSDDSYYKAFADFGGTGAPIQLTVTGISSVASINSLRFIAEMKAAVAGGTQVVKLWNYTTNAYDTIDSRPITATDQTVDVTITSNPSKYVNPANRNLKSLIEMSPVPARSVRNWFASVDRAVWITTHP
jgi:hypothetical protein